VGWGDAVNPCGLLWCLGSTETWLTGDAVLCAWVDWKVCMGAIGVGWESLEFSFGRCQLSPVIPMPANVEEET
jgi:hypothetical protein